MSKKIQAYFNNEDQALDVQAKLVQYEVRNMEIGKTGRNSDGVIAPFFPFVGGITTSTTGVGTAGIGGIGIVALGGLLTGDNHSDEYTVVLSGEINDEFYSQAVEVIKDNYGHVAAVNEI